MHERRGVLRTQINMLFVLFLLSASNSKGFMSQALLTLRSNPIVAREGTPVALSCLHTLPALLEVNWERNDMTVLKTRVTNTSTSQSGNKIFNSTLGPASASLYQHNLTIISITLLDHGSVWRCRSGQDFSNSITIYVMPQTTGRTYPSIPTAVPALPEERDGRAITIMAIVVSVIGTVMAIATLFCLYVKRQRKLAKRNRKTSNKRVLGPITRDIHNIRHTTKYNPGYYTASHYSNRGSQLDIYRTVNSIDERHVGTLVYTTTGNVSKNNLPHRGTVSEDNVLYKYTGTVSKDYTLHKNTGAVSKEYTLHKNTGTLQEERLAYDNLLFTTVL